MLGGFFGRYGYYREIEVFANGLGNVLKYNFLFAHGSGGVLVGGLRPIPHGDDHEGGRCEVAGPTDLLSQPGRVVKADRLRSPYIPR